jgi:hypothetical protein
MGISFNGLIGLFMLLASLAVGSGHGEWVWKGLVYMRFYALKEAKKDWGNPSIWTRDQTKRFKSSHS